MVSLEISPDEAATRLRASSAIFQEIKADDMSARAYFRMGRHHKQHGNTEQARDYLTEALEIFERPGTLIEPDKVRKELAELPS